ncbi:MAG: thioredoxin domain-containing protein [Leptonema sp. (in: bacteria)]
MEKIYFYNYFWQNIFYFLSGPVAFLIFIYAIFEKKQSKKIYYTISLVLLFIFIANAKKNEQIPIIWLEQKKYLPEDIPQIIKNHKHKPIFLFFYADWCQSCKDLEKKLQKKEIAELLNHGWINIRVDVTNFELYKEQILKDYNVYGTPTISFIDVNGNIMKPLTLVGSEIPLNTLISILRQFGEFDPDFKKSL